MYLSVSTESQIKQGGMAITPPRMQGGMAITPPRMQGGMAITQPRIISTNCFCLEGVVLHSLLFYQS